MNPDHRLELGRGDGTVVAVPGVAMLVMDPEAPESLLAVVRAGAAVRSPGRDLARRLAGLLTGEAAAEVPPFGMIADVDDGLLVFLYGPVVAVTGSQEGGRLSGSQATTWVDRVLGPEPQTVVIAPEAAAVPATTSFELTAGIVPGGWMRITSGRPSLAIDAGDRAVAEPAGRPGVALDADGPEPEETPAAAPPRPADGPLDDPSPPVPAANPLPEETSSPASTAVPATDPQTAPLAAMPPVAPPPIPPPGASEASTDPTADDAATPDPGEVPTTDPTGGAAPEPTGGAAPEPTGDAAPAFESLPLTPDRTSLREPLPAEGRGPQDDEPEPVPERKMVQGIRCSRQHFNSPDSAYCSSCGISMVHQTHNLVRGERPPLGFLVFDDGSTFTLDDRYVLGREPETDPLVQNDEARPIPLDDPQMSVSRVHAEIRLVGWDVQLMDRGSTNGTHILNQRGDGWDPVPPQQPLTVAPGSRIAVGQRTFVYETPQRG